MMRQNRMRSLHLARSSVAAAAIMAACPFAEAADKPVDYNRDIRPLLSNNCYKCHGPDKNERQAGLRLDQRNSATGKLESDNRAIVPGDRRKSELWKRISAEDSLFRMPPDPSGKSLTPAQIELIGKWIDQGAKYQRHWAFIPPKRPKLPAVRNKQWVRNPIDRFVLARLESPRVASRGIASRGRASGGFVPSPPADKTTLIRRVTFDLTGLPPTIEEIDAFLNDTSPNAYEKLVDRLLKSPHYGEHRTRFWLDSARYGDTHGLHLDNVRTIWPYRDWVIRAFNQNMPFDRFTVEQIAGDLLPDATLSQKVATGFNRCNVTTSEGGSIAEEYRVRYAVDRVETIGTVFMGLTVGCAVCHDHKFDPVSQTEFYQLFAFYANTADRAMDGNKPLPPPSIRVPSPEQIRRKQEYERRVAELQRTIREKVAAIDYSEPKSPGDVQPPKPREIVWIDDSLPTGAAPQGNEGSGSWTWVTAEDGPVFSGEKSHTRTAEGLSQHFFTAAKPGLKITSGDKLFAYVYIDPDNPPEAVMLQFNDGRWEHRAYWGKNRIPFGRNNTTSRRRLGKLPAQGKWVRLEVSAQQVGLKPGSTINGWAFTQFGGKVHWDKAGIVRVSPLPAQFDSQLAWEAAVKNAGGKSALPKAVSAALRVPRDKRNEAQKKTIRNHFLEHVYSKTRKQFAPLHREIAAVQHKLKELDESTPSTLIMLEKTANRRPTYVLKRGEYDKPDKSRKVEPAVPAALGKLPADAAANRLSLARWLVSKDHPLTARVTVNRFWQQYFGTGLVKTAEDFGSQGDWPSHPELLDWLAREFIDSGWDVKRLHKLIVMSATYRQSSKVTPEKLKRDPHNRLLSRGPRYRLDAEMIRDNALAVSGLLVRKIGGPSVKPYQPKGLWKAVGYTDSNTANFKQDHGTKLYRRSMYTFWKRTAPPPTMSTFDAPSREACTVRRERTNTPLQALALMNDVQFVEASRKFAERIMTAGGKTVAERITFAFRSCTARKPTAEEIAVIKSVYQSHLAEYRKDKPAALKLLSVGESERDGTLDVPELAAWTMVANLVLNLDETITKG